MDQGTYKQFLGQLEGLTEAQAAEVKEKLRRRQAGREVRRLVAERLSEQGGCPHCGHAGVVKFGTTQGTQRFRCK
ncbi:MAG: hypothetical protein LBT71_04515, partial [Azoarcus sp.]|nr:hypothetical protein [Azoarcus sp.]